MESGQPRLPVGNLSFLSRWRGERFGKTVSRSGVVLGTWKLRRWQEWRSPLLQVLALVGISCWASFNRTSLTSLPLHPPDQSSDVRQKLHGLTSEGRVLGVALGALLTLLAGISPAVGNGQTSRQTPVCSAPPPTTFSSLTAVKQLANVSFLSRGRREMQS